MAFLAQYTAFPRVFPSFLAPLGISCVFRQRLMCSLGVPDQVSSQYHSRAFLDHHWFPHTFTLDPPFYVLYTFRWKYCLSAGRPILYLAIEEPQFEGFSFKSPNYLTKGLTKRFTRLRCRRRERRKISMEVVEAHAGGVQTKEIVNSSVCFEVSL